MSPHEDPSEFPTGDPADRTVTFDRPDGFTIPVERPVRRERATTEPPADQPLARPTGMRIGSPVGLRADPPPDPPADSSDDPLTGSQTGSSAERSAGSRAGSSEGRRAGQPADPRPDSSADPVTGSPAGPSAGSVTGSFAEPYASSSAEPYAGSSAEQRTDPSTGQSSDPDVDRAGAEVRPGRVRGWFVSMGVVLLTLTALPAIALALPNTSMNGLVPARDALGLDNAGMPGLIRAAGLALPALLLAVPVFAVASRRFSPRLVLLFGLALLLGGIGAARFAETVPAIAGGRVLQGLGAGAVLPAVLVLVMERQSRFLAVIWAGTLAASLIVAMPLALHATPLPGGGAPPADWRVAFAPYPGIAAAALAAAFLCVLLRSRSRLSSARRAERGQLLLPAVPAAGFAFLAVVTTYGWSPGAQLVVGGIAMTALLGLAMVGSRDTATGSPLGCAVVMVTTGLLTYPLAGPLSGLANASATMRGATDPRLHLVPFAAAALAALLGAIATVRMSRDAARGAVLSGHGLAIVAVLVCLATDTASDPWLLLAPLVPLGAGLGMALAASLRDAGVGAALFGLTLGFPAVLVGQLLVLALQAGQIQRLRPENGAQQLYGLTAGFRIWVIVAGVLTVLLVAACVRVTAARERAPRSEGRRRAGNLLA
ncbi:hypothetical protein [Actinomadura sp. 6N118]|uniref:hypothetical protein n=1 Tax=Actinomadura sp. 6N118 TaxID=3375151 RepID=UPI0037B9572B